MNRCGAAVLRQQRRVDVDQPEAWPGEHRIRQDLAVGRDDAQIWFKGRKAVEEGRVFQFLGLEDRNASCARQLFDRRLGCLLSTATGPVRLGDHADNRVGRRQETLERRHAERRGAEEHNPYHFPVRCSLRILRAIRSRLTPRNRSMKTVPSR